MRSSSTTAAPPRFRAAIPPNTLEVIRHSPGARLTTSPNGHDWLLRHCDLGRVRASLALNGAGELDDQGPQERLAAKASIGCSLLRGRERVAIATRRIVTALHRPLDGQQRPELEARTEVVDLDTRPLLAPLDVDPSWTRGVADGVGEQFAHSQLSAAEVRSSDPVLALLGGVQKPQVGQETGRILRFFVSRARGG